MSLPFEFDIKFFFRLLLPGFFLAIGSAPIVFTIMDWVGLPSEYEIGFGISIILMGWVVFILDGPIYMIFEGRLFWPEFLHNFFLSCEQKRLLKAVNTINNFQFTEPRKYLEASVELRGFPINSGGEFEAYLPSRLGNLITAYETYPSTRYGIDAAFYWYRLWLKLNQDIREEISNEQAVAHSVVYTSFALYFTGILGLVYAVLSTLMTLPIRHLPSPFISYSVSFLFIWLAYLAYRASVYTQGRFGELFKSVFDNYSKDIDVSIAMERLTKVTGDTSYTSLPHEEQLQVAWRYLHNYRVKCPKCQSTISAIMLSGHNIKCTTAETSSEANS